MSAPASAPSQRWLWGPTSDLLFGCGVLYMALFLLLITAGPVLRQLQPAWLLPLLVILVSMPHYGGTLVRVYETRSERRSYWVFTVYITLVIVAFFVTGLYVPLVGSIFFTIYLTWSPWHYTGQNYGIAVMFLRRRGVDLPARTKRMLYASFVLSYAIVFLTFHTAEGGAVAYNLDIGSKGVAFLPLGIPTALSHVLIPLVGLGYLATTALAFSDLLRRAPRDDLGPTALLALSQTLWFALPMVVEGMGFSTGVEALDKQRAFRTYVLWVALAHAAQYLWVTSYYAKAKPDWHGRGLYYGKVLAAGVAAWTLPAILFAPDLLGRPAYDAGLGLMVAAGVNLHHFVLDGAIWKLRNLRIGNVLIRSGVDEAGAITPERVGLRRGVWAVLAAAVPIALFAFLKNDVQVPASAKRHDWRAAAQGLDQLAWTGRDSASRRLTLARAAFRSGDPDLAVALYRRRVQLDPDPVVYNELGYVLAQQGDLDHAIAAFEAGLGIEPDDPSLLLQAGRAELSRGELERALRHLDRLASLRPDDTTVKAELDRAHRALEAQAGSDS